MGCRVELTAAMGREVAECGWCCSLREWRVVDFSTMDGRREGERHWVRWWRDGGGKVTTRL
jgi:hypothetical protein